MAEAPRRLLADLLQDWAVEVPDLRISGLAMNTAELRPGDAFLAVPGAETHGLQYAGQAAAAGAVAVLYDPSGNDTGAVPQVPADMQLPMVALPGLGGRLAELASTFYGAPAEQLEVVAVTGTNGKTSTAHFTAQAWPGTAGFVGTIGRGLLDRLTPSDRTTPDPVGLQRALYELVRDGADLAAVEASSHALDQGRLETVSPTVGIFTNLSRDHFDYHPDFAHYEAAKRRLFTHHQPRFGVINVDDPVGARWARELSASHQILSYGLSARQRPDVLASLLESPGGELRVQLTTPWGSAEIRNELVGDFNAYNLAAAAGALGLLGVDWPVLRHGLEQLRPVPGRMRRFGGNGHQPVVVVDFAHTPDALAKALETLRHQCRGRLICVFGCGGDKDHGKRPQMGRAVEQVADLLVITSDNPRSESPEAIIDDVVAGLERPDAVHRDADRAAAIRWAIAAATGDDIVLVAGKGHEQFQQIGEHFLPFNDETEILQALGMAA